MTVKEAAEALSVSPSSIRGLAEEIDPITKRSYLTPFRPTPRRLLIWRNSVEAHKKNIEDPEFWEKRRRGAFFFASRTGGRSRTARVRRPR